MQKSQIKEKLKSAIQIYKKTKDPRAAEVIEHFGVVVALVLVPEGVHYADGLGQLRPAGVLEQAHDQDVGNGHHELDELAVHNALNQESEHPEKVHIESPVAAVLVHEVHHQALVSLELFRIASVYQVPGDDAGCNAVEGALEDDNHPGGPVRPEDIDGAAEFFDDAD